MTKSIFHKFFLLLWDLISSAVKLCRRLHCSKLVNKIGYTRQAFNLFHRRLQFIVKGQKNFSIYFLDIKLKYNETGQIETDWLTKKDWSQSYLNFNTTSLLHFTTQSFRRDSIRFIISIITN